MPRTSSARRSSTEKSVPAAVYLIQRLDRRRFKLGTAIDPLVRAAQLPEHSRNCLDLKSSLALWLPSRTRANEVERGMHKCLAPYRVSPGHTQDGFSEWFTPVAFPIAIRFLQQMPSDSSTQDTLGLRPLLVDGARVVQRQYFSPQEVWWTIEDLLMRLADILGVHVEVHQGAVQFVIHGFRHAHDGDMTELRPRTVDLATYAWHTEQGRGDWLRFIDYRQDDLLLILASHACIERWQDGPNLVWQVRGLMAKLGASLDTMKEIDHAR